MKTKIHQRVGPVILNGSSFIAVNGLFDSRGREVDIRWSTCNLDDVPGGLRYHPSYCVVQVNNVFNNPLEEGKDRWVAFPRPQVIFQYYDGFYCMLKLFMQISNKKLNFIGCYCVSKRYKDIVL